MENFKSIRILTFAHRGEAQVFLKKESFRLMPEIQSDIYFNGNDYLVITGEGLYCSASKLSFLIGYIKSSNHFIFFYF